MRLSELHSSLPDDSHFNPQELKKGIKVEKDEHKMSRFRAKITAKQHLMEIPDYYTRLEKMEKEYKTEKQKKPAPEKSLASFDSYGSGDE